MACAFVSFEHFHKATAFLTFVITPDELPPFLTNLL